jgi:hypothetical protein
MRRQSTRIARQRSGAIARATLLRAYVVDMTEVCFAVPGAALVRVVALGRAVAVVYPGLGAHEAVCTVSSLAALLAHLALTGAAQQSTSHSQY